jgi:hypothetical protein
LSIKLCESRLARIIEDENGVDHSDFVVDCGGLVVVDGNLVAFGA